MSSETESQSLQISYSAVNDEHFSLSAHRSPATLFYLDPTTPKAMLPSGLPVAKGDIFVLIPPAALQALTLTSQSTDSPTSFDKLPSSSFSLQLFNLKFRLFHIQRATLESYLLYLHLPLIPPPQARIPYKTS